MSSERYLPIEEHGVVGDLYTIALIGIDGTVDYLCFPMLDSPTVFASLLDADKGGSFQLGPVPELDGGQRRQLYLPSSNILLTRFLSEQGVGEITDFMPVESEDSIAHNLVRSVKCVRGEMKFRMSCQPRFDYGRADHTLERRGEKQIVFTSHGPDGSVLLLRSSVPLEVRDGDVYCEFTLCVDETADFVLELVSDSEESICATDFYVNHAFQKTLDFWRRWIGRSNYRGRWRETVDRSALTLKLLFSSRHGSLAAAGTFGLPEALGGERNWDYRFAWIRDASFAFYALSRLGISEEATHFMRWIVDRCDAMENPGQLQVLYGLDGRSIVEEQTLDHLEGYRGSRPVRIGNHAYQQLQLDIYGELLDAIYLNDKYGEPISLDLWAEIRQILSWLADNWQQPDEGIWETRGGRKHFLYSRVMCWVAFDRAIRLARRRSLPLPLTDWVRTRDTIHADILESFWSDELRAFVQYAGAKTLDAATLIMPLVRFIGPTDPRWLSTLEAIERDLVKDSFVHRYRVGDEFHDGLAGKEGTFSLCSFWYAECLSRAGYLQRARLAFEKMLGYSNHLGLFAEELGPCGEHLGNFPQAFTHMGLISAAYDLNRRLDARGEEA